jgi:hypothetical protein
VKQNIKNNSGWELYNGLFQIHWKNGWADKVEVGGKIFVATKVTRLPGRKK